MARLPQSYIHGACNVPLIGDTIGMHFDKVVKRWRSPAGFSRLGSSPVVNINPAYRLAELEYALNKVGCKALVTASGFKTSDYVSMLRELAPEIDGSVRGKLCAARLPALSTLIRIGAGDARGFFAFKEVLEIGDGCHCNALGERNSRLQFDDPINIQFTSGTTGFPKGATLTHHNILNNGYFNGEAQRRARPGLHSGAALSLLRHGDGKSQLRHPRRHHGLSVRKLRSVGDA
jgi:fatty-acyl-CoA synthase